MLYTIENQSGESQADKNRSGQTRGASENSTQFLHVFLNDGNHDYRSASKSLFKVSEGPQPRFVIRRIENASIYLGQTDRSTTDTSASINAESGHIVRLVNDQLVLTDESN